jgi:hypothetical protein
MIAENLMDSECGFINYTVYSNFIQYRKTLN